jgi:hypothetical protein
VWLAIGCGQYALESQVSATKAGKKMDGPFSF